jgi:hypothetical protein
MLLGYFVIFTFFWTVLSFSSSFNKIQVIKSRDLSTVDLGENIQKYSKDNQLIIFGTYAADFNAIEYAQRLRFYLPSLKAKGIKRTVLILNASPSASLELANLVDLPSEVEIFSDPDGL